jgi:hypothetical protein
VTHVPLIEVSFGNDSTSVLDTYSTFSPTGTGCMQTGGGFESSTGSTTQDVWSGSATADVDRRPTFNQQNHYASVRIKRTGDSFSPAVLARFSAAGQDGYQLDPGTWAGTVELGEWSGGVYTLLASGLISPPSVDDTMQLQCDGTTISGGINGVGDVSTTDSTHTTGLPGIGCDSNPGAAVGDDFEAGHIETNQATTRIVQNDSPALRERRRRRAETKRELAATEG